MAMLARFGGMLLAVFAGTGLLSGSAAAVQPEVAGAGQPVAGDTIEFKEGLAISGVAVARRYPLRIDALERQIVAGTFARPVEGAEVTLPDGKTKAWTKVVAGEDGSIPGDQARGGYVYWRVASSAERVMILEASGHGMVYVNGEPRVGDPYANGIVGLPVLLKAGDNEFLFAFGRGNVRAKLVAPRSLLMIETRDATLPDLVVGEKGPLWGAVVIVNATKAPLSSGWELIASSANGRKATAVPVIPPLSAMKVPFEIEYESDWYSNATGSVALELFDARPAVVADGSILKAAATAAVDLRVRQPGQTVKRTFVSGIDGSLQYYAVNPAAGGATDRTAMVLSLHGASVEAISQADSYGQKSWATIVCPTNRRPFGFDWEDWGRLDALEVLADAQRKIPYDRSRVYLTGHSMGGHGTWQLGALFPDKFAAIGPSAGWSSFASYTGTGAAENPEPTVEMVQRAAASSDTLAYARNYESQGVYILHGDADDNVPVKQARDMREALSAFHQDLHWHEQPGAGHWWGNDIEAGTACVDWGPMFDLFARRRLASDAETRYVKFVTPAPGISASSHWATIEAQATAMRPSGVDLRCDPAARRFVGTTENVERLSLGVGHLGEGAISAELDGQKLGEIPRPVGSEARIWLEREDGPSTDLKTGRWHVVERPSAALKGPRRNGLFKDAFRNRAVLVYGTKGTAEENAWSFAKARYDAETFWYRGNGSFEVMADTEFRAVADADRNVVLYGNAETNAAWAALLGESPVQVRRDGVRVGEREVKGEDLACLFIRPRAGSATASVGVVSGTGMAGMRLVTRLPYFQSGVGYPDVTVLGSAMLEKGGEGVRCAGYFGNDWSVERGEWAWRE